MVNITRVLYAQPQEKRSRDLRRFFESRAGNNQQVPYETRRAIKRKTLKGGTSGLARGTYVRFDDAFLVCRFLGISRKAVRAAMSRCTMMDTQGDE